MTVVAAMVGDGYVAMAADSICSDGTNVVWHAPGKLFELPVGRDQPALVATAGAAALRPALCSIGLPTSPDPADVDDCDSWAQGVAEAFTDVARERKLLRQDSAHEIDGNALLAWYGHLWELTDNYALRIPRFAAIGAGGQIALGAMEVLAGPDDPEVIVRLAAEAAVRWHTDCGGKVILRTTRPQ